jgi:hypothetical protein
MEQVTAIELGALMKLKEPIREIIDRNVGTQYYSLANLRLMDHPYKVRGSGRPGGLPAGVVNRQSGVFSRSLRIRGPLLLGRDRISITVFSRGEKPLGNWLLTGTGRMRGRPWTSQLRTEIYKIMAPIIATLGKRMRLRVKV